MTARPGRWVAALTIAALVLGACRGEESPSESTSSGGPSAARAIRNDQPWRMHAIDSRYRGANALFRADVDGDGRDDYVTNYEFDQRFVIEFAPRDAANLTRPWPTMTWFCPTADPATKACDTESAALGDLDGDGNLDIIGPQGGHPDRIVDGDEPGVRVVWGPDRSGVRDAKAWSDAGRFPATIEQGHYLWAQPYDVNGDGAVDVMAGGRVYFGNGRTGGIVWLEAPHEQARRRDLSAWKLHAIDPLTPGGHGFVLADLDGDGDPDLVDATADFDTPEDQEAVVWYRNPGPSSTQITKPWPRTELLRDRGFYGKPQVAVADMNDDGRDDLVTQTIDDFLFFLRREGREVAFDLVRVHKPESIRWASRGLRVADFDGDGRKDVLAMLTHDNGVLPAAKASVYWLSFDNGRLAAHTMHVHTIKWSAGRVSDTPIFGEKWDQVDVRDVDGDGDLDIVANDEEWAQEPDGEFALYSKRGAEGETVAVVWFENRLHDAAPSCREDKRNRCVLEAEAPTEVDDGTWIERNALRGASGGAYLQAFNGRDPANCPAELTSAESERDCPRRANGTLQAGDSDGVRYDATLEGGDYDVWLRVYAPVRFGARLGGARSDSAYLAIDDSESEIVGDRDVDAGAWTWVRAHRAVALSPGKHTIAMRVRERGVAVDEIALTTAGVAPR